MSTETHWHLPHDEAPSFSGDVSDFFEHTDSADQDFSTLKLQVEGATLTMFIRRGRPQLAELLHKLAADLQASHVAALSRRLELDGETAFTVTFGDEVPE